MQFCIRIYTPFTSVLKSGNQIIISKCFFLEKKFILSKARGRKKQFFGLKYTNVGEGRKKRANTGYKKKTNWKNHDHY